jgi:hypothetical protein
MHRSWRERNVKVSISQSFNQLDIDPTPVTPFTTKNTPLVFRDPYAMRKASLRWMVMQA